MAKMIGQLNTLAGEWGMAASVEEVPLARAKTILGGSKKVCFIFNNRLPIQS